VIHLGGVRFPITGPLRFTMTARDAVELLDLIRPRVAIPIHYEGWAHFREGRDEIERVTDRFRWLPIGEAVEV
jgi:L-ascorbate metabolism protein UlaG (beta-lactamase superfamily)